MLLRNIPISVDSRAKCSLYGNSLVNNYNYDQFAPGLRYCRWCKRNRIPLWGGYLFRQKHTAHMARCGLMVLSSVDGRSVCCKEATVWQHRHHHLCCSKRYTEDRSDTGAEEKGAPFSACCFINTCVSMLLMT